MFGILRDEGFERLVRLSEFPFLPLRFGEQNIGISGGRRVGVTSDYLFVFLRGVRARQRKRCSGRAAIGIKPITRERNSCKEDNDRGCDNWLFETLPKKTRFQCDIARWRWRCWHKRRVLDQFENRVRVVLCHAKVSRASGGNNHKVPCHSERSEESQFIICDALAKPTSQKCFPSLNMTTSPSRA